MYYVIRSASLALFQETPRLRACGYAMHWQRKAPRPSFPRKAESYEQCEKQLEALDFRAPGGGKGVAVSLHFAFGAPLDAMAETTRLVGWPGTTGEEVNSGQRRTNMCLPCPCHPWMVLARMTSRHQS